VRSIFASSWTWALALLHSQPLKKTLAKAAERTAESAKRQTAAALDLGAHFDPDLSAEVAQLASGVFEGTEDLMKQSLTRAEDVLNEWADLDPELSPRAGDLDALGGMLDDGLSGISGRALANVALDFGAAFGAMIQTAQTSAGVQTYMWLTQRDSRVRKAHLELDGEIADWDDPPLSSDVSDNEEDNHPGEDYGCRCVASPIAPDEELTERQYDRV